MKMEHTESDRKVNIVITKKKKKPRNGFFSICVNDIYRSHYVMESGRFGFFFCLLIYRGWWARGKEILYQVSTRNVYEDD